MLKKYRIILTSAYTSTKARLHRPPRRGAAGRNSRDCSVQRRPGRDRPGQPGERPSLVPGARCELRIVGVTGYSTEKRNNLVQPREANEDVHDPGQRSLWTTEQSCNQIDLEQAHQAPVQGANNNEKKRSNVDHSHRSSPLLKDGALRHRHRARPVSLVDDSRSPVLRSGKP